MIGSWKIFLSGGMARDEEGFEKLGPPAKCSKQPLLNKNQSWHQKCMKSRAFHPAHGHEIAGILDLLNTNNKSNKL